MARLYEYELGKASDILMRDMFAVKPGETVVITADTESDERVVNAAARSAFAFRGEADGNLAAGCTRGRQGGGPHAAGGRAGGGLMPSGCLGGV